jgi:hypothetical protein
MAIMDRFRGHDHASPANSTMIEQDPEKNPQMLKGGAKEIFRVRIIAMAIIVSMGGVCVLQITYNLLRLMLIVHLWIRHRSNLWFLGDA